MHKCIQRSDPSFYVIGITTFSHALADHTEKYFRYGIFKEAHTRNNVGGHSALQLFFFLFRLFDFIIISLYISEYYSFDIPMDRS